MRDKILLYGASGYSGRIVAERAARRWRDGQRFELLLGGRNGDTLAALAHELGVASRVFALDDERQLRAVLAEPGLFAVINAAGPFAHTAWTLAREAVRAGRHYVDINGEADVYQRLDDLGYVAAQAGVTLVSGAGHSATTSDLLLDQALRQLRRAGCTELGNISIANANWRHLTRGSALTAARSLREQVLMMREDRPGPQARLRIGHAPLGQIERVFDFGDFGDFGDFAATGSTAPQPRRRIASAVTLLDLFTARLTVQRHRADGGPSPLERVRRIEGFVEVTPFTRNVIGSAGITAPLLALPGVQALLQTQLAAWPEGPDRAERQHDRHTVLLQIDDGCGATLIDWCVQTPSPYSFTADCVLAVVDGLPALPAQPGAQAPGARPCSGWRTPAELVGDAGDLGDLQSSAAPHPPRDTRQAAGALWRACRFWPRRTVPAAAAAKPPPPARRRLAAAGKP